MLSLNRFLISSFVFSCVINGGLFKEIPDYLHVCKRDPNTLEACVIKSIESLVGMCKDGIKEINVPSLDPFFLKETAALTADNAPIRASGHNINITGVRNLTIKSLSVDLDTLKFKLRVHFPMFHVEGIYNIETMILILPTFDDGKFDADFVNWDMDLLIHTQMYTKDGQEYIKFKNIDVIINFEDYRIKLDGLFKGDKILGAAGNKAIHQNRGELSKILIPSIEKMVSKNLLDISNKIVNGYTLDQLLPKP